MISLLVFCLLFLFDELLRKIERDVGVPVRPGYGPDRVDQWREAAKQRKKVKRKERLL